MRLPLRSDSLGSAHLAKHNLLCAMEDTLEDDVFPMVGGTARSASAAWHRRCRTTRRAAMKRQAEKRAARRAFRCEERRAVRALLAGRKHHARQPQLYTSWGVL